MLRAWGLSHQQDQLEKKLFLIRLGARGAGFMSIASSRGCTTSTGAITRDHERGQIIGKTVMPAAHAHATVRTVTYRVSLPAGLAGSACEGQEPLE
jgi:hypothetical protein